MLKEFPVLADSAHTKRIVELGCGCVWLLPTVVYRLSGASELVLIKAELTKAELHAELS